MLKFLFHSLTVIAIVTSGCSRPIETVTPVPDPTITASATGILTGVITKGPTSPVEVPGAPGFVAAVGVRLNITTEDGKPVASVETDSAGRYMVRLAPGSYRVTMELEPGAMFTRDLPAKVTITLGEQKQLDVHLDTGIR